MEHTQVSKRDYSVIGWSLLLIWWGVVMIVGPLTFGMGALGTGVICLGLNAFRRLNGVPTVASTTTIGLIALLWGAVDAIFNPSFGLSFAALLIVIGVVIFVRDLLPDGPADSDATD